jgi:hypothetical protein
MGADWGDVPTWLGGIFAAVAALGAVATLRGQRRQIQEQRDFLRAQTALLDLDHQQRVVAQALGVSLDVKKCRGPLWEMIDSLGPWHHWRVVVRNGSSGPITDVEVLFGANRPRQITVGSVRIPEASLIAIQAHDAAEYRSPEWVPHHLDAEAPTVTFTDLNGVRWCLDRYGALRKASPGEGG